MSFVPSGRELLVDSCIQTSENTASLITGTIQKKKVRNDQGNDQTIYRHAIRFS